MNTIRNEQLSVVFPILKNTVTTLTRKKYGNNQIASQTQYQNSESVSSLVCRRGSIMVGGNV